MKGGRLAKANTISATKSPRTIESTTRLRVRPAVPCRHCWSAAMPLWGCSTTIANQLSMPSSNVCPTQIFLIPQLNLFTAAPQKHSLQKRCRSFHVSKTGLMYCLTSMYMMASISRRRRLYGQAREHASRNLLVQCRYPGFSYTPDLPISTPEAVDDMKAPPS